MRVLSWTAGIVVIVALAVGATSAVAARTTTGHSSMTAAKKQVALVVDNGVNGKDPSAQRMIPRPTPEPSPTPPPVAAPVVAAPVVAAAAPAPVAPRPVPPSIVIGSTQQALINQDRARNGLWPLTWSSCLAGVARSNAARIAAQGTLTHTNGPSLDLNCGLGHQAGENIGYWSAGVNDTQLNTMFMNSPEHRANILGPYHSVASVWVVAANGYGYIAVEFS
ncbi:MAG: CAP domain-containing protein [Candidatus Dormibacteraceae bacterium]